MADHTPGPWAVHYDDDGVEIRAAGDMMGIIIHGKEMDANARLITQSPELLRILVDLVEQVEAYDLLHGQNTCAIDPDAARAAIAKIEEG